MHIARNIIERRKRLGLTQRELARRTGLTNVWICMVEHGRVPSIPTLERIAGALDSSLEELVRKPRRRS